MPKLNYFFKLKAVFNFLRSVSSPHESKGCLDIAPFSIYEHFTEAALAHARATDTGSQLFAIRYNFLLASLFCLICFGNIGCKKSEELVLVEQTKSNATESPKANEADNRPIILAFGDSLTEGYGLNKSQAYPAELQKKIDAFGFKYRVVNAGISGDTTSGGATRIDKALSDFPNTKIMILELGANDMLRAKDLRETRQNLSQIIEKAQTKNIRIILAGMEAPVNFGEDYQREFHNLFADLTKKYKLAFIPFFLQDVALKPELNQSDGIHPNSKGIAIVVENVWKILVPEIK
jgi:acyl-CoA thioesterase I